MAGMVESRGRIIQISCVPMRARAPSGIVFEARQKSDSNPVADVVTFLTRLPRLAGIGLIHLYRLFLSPLIGRECRYLPTCSEYTEDAIRKYGLWRGFWIGLSRIQRCGPFGASGFDPVPEALPERAHWYTPWRYGHWTGKHIDPKTRLDL